MQPATSIPDISNFPLSKRQAVIAANLIFWLLFIIFDSISTSATLTGYFSYTFTRTLLHCIPFALLVYINLYWLYPRFFSKQQHIKYTIGVLILLAINLFSRFQIDEFMSKPETLENYFPWIYDPVLSQKALNAFINGGFISKNGGFSFSYHLGMTIGSIGVFVITSSLNLVEDWVEKQQLKIKILKEEALAQQAQLRLKVKEVELRDAKIRFLKAQSDPHFLINSLSGVYNLALLQHDKIDYAILRLSDLMSYLLGKGKEDYIYLQYEIDFIHNYLSFLKTIYLDEINISFDFEATPSQLSHIEIAPMLIQPFLENAIKHGNVTDSDKGWVKSFLKIDGPQIIFTIQNSVHPKRKNRKIQSHGVGLSNLKERLSVYYPNNYELQTGLNGNIYSVRLVLGLD